MEYIASEDDVCKKNNFIVDNRPLACEAELRVTLSAGWPSMPGIGYDLVITVHIHCNMP